MAITDPLVLPADVLLVPVKDLPESVRQQVIAEEGDYALTRPHSRSPSRIVNAQSIELLKEFQKPVTIVQAIIRYSREKKTDPEQALEEAFPMLERLAQARLLVPADSEEACQIQQSLEVGARFVETEVLRCLQALEDTELYQVKTRDGQSGALKILRPNAGAGAERMFDREAAILERLGGEDSPELLQSGSEDGRRYLLIEWCSGVECSLAAAELRRSGSAEAKGRLVRLCGAILDAYARLHSRNVIHSDIHPRNVLVNGADQVKIIDFGLARVAASENKFRRTHRGGIGFFFEPEYAKAASEGKVPPHSSPLGEQYSLATLIYFLITGNHYLDFSLEKHEMLRQIAEEAPLEFTRRSAEAWPELEQVLARALKKHPSDRFPSVADFAEQLKAVAVPETAILPIPDSKMAPAAYPDAEKMLRGMLARLNAEGPLFASGLKTGPRVSVTYGSAGVAYGLYRIACMREDAQLLALADLWATRAARDMELGDAFYNKEIEITPEVVGRVSPYHTGSGVHLVQGLIGHAMGDVVSQQRAVEKFVDAASSAPCENLDVTLGRSGTLLGAALLLEAISGSTFVNANVLVEFGNEALNGLWSKLQEFTPIRECREVAYSGIAHGWAGMLYATMSWCRSSGTALPAGIEERLDQLVRLADQSGRRARWKWRIRGHRLEQGETYLPGWCNGSAGFVHLWTLAHQMLGKAAHGALAEKAGFDAWESEGKIGNLCCGFAGQAYALLNLYKHTGDKEWLHRAQAQAQRAARSIMELPGGDYSELTLRAESLYKGELGVAVLAAEFERPEFATMPFFEKEA
jgi:eukaryotic-like serine/threonine-protein kinase